MIFSTPLALCESTSAGDRSLTGVSAATLIPAVFVDLAIEVMTKLSEGGMLTCPTLRHSCIPAVEFEGKLARSSKYGYRLHMYAVCVSFFSVSFRSSTDISHCCMSQRHRAHALSSKAYRGLLMTDD